MKQGGLYQNKVTVSLASIHNYKMAYFEKTCVNSLLQLPRAQLL